ncbi:MAG: protein translocase subunit SecD [Candidatus Gracilibacteria bacterium]|nr:protein translocase subunit SecD [Candidatus Gracilibacteria bacterium]
MAFVIIFLLFYKKYIISETFYPISIFFMRHLIFRIFLITVSGFLLVAYVFPWHNYNINVPFSGGDYRLGLDLQGGIELDYKIDLSEVSKAEDYNSKKESEIVEGLKSIVDKRVETLNINDSEINDASYAGENHIIVQIPLKGNDSLENSLNIEKAKEAIGKVVKIQFKEKKSSFTQEDFDARNKIANDTLLEITTGEKFSVVAAKTSLNFENIIVGSIGKYEELIKVNNEIKVNQINEVELLNGDAGYLLVENSVKDSKINYIFVSKTPSEWTAAIDSKGRVLDDKYFSQSSVQFNDAFQPMIELVFNDEGAEIFGELSKRLIGQQMAIFVGGEMLTAPVINEAIYGGKAVITGNYTPEEAKKLSNDINTGVVPAPIYLTSEKTIDSKIGASSLEKLVIAGYAGFLLIFLFLVFTYRVSGLMAAVSLLLYVLIVLAIVKMFGIVLTLASIAGLILSIGIAIDSNILIFERIREELRRGNDIVLATDTGFRKTWSAIWDSNFTGLIVSFILFIFGVNLIKGFGLMLGLGIIVSLFTVMWISKVFLLLNSLLIKNKSTFIGFKK